MDKKKARTPRTVTIHARYGEAVTLRVVVMPEHENEPTPAPAIAGLPPYAEAATYKIRALRTLGRQSGLASYRKIGTLSGAEILRLLYPRQGDGDATG